MISGLKRLNHVALAIREKETYERSVSFYRGTLGLELVRRWAIGQKHITMLDMGNCVLEIICGAPGSGEGAIPHIALETERKEDVDRMLALCASAGCTVTRPASDIESHEEAENGGQGAPISLRNGFCLGPAGESIEFFWQKN